MDFFKKKSINYTIVFLLVVGAISQWFLSLPVESILVRDVFSIELEFLELSNYYLYINLFTIIFPFLLSFDKKVAFYREWKPLMLSTLIVGGFFILWDVHFTHEGVWGFNERYLSGIECLGLPLGEWLFFITVPYACTFIYACLKAYFKTNPFQKSIDHWYAFIFIILVIAGTASLGKVYFSSTCLLTAAFLLFQYKHMDDDNRSWFLSAYAISWIPFMLVDGLLTGLGTQEPIVMYHPDEFSGIRIGSIPFDDSVYSMLLLGGVIYFYEIFKKSLS